jgi:hypothetical protein
MGILEWKLKMNLKRTGGGFDESARSKFHFRMCETEMEENNEIQNDTRAMRSILLSSLE